MAARIASLLRRLSQVMQPGWATSIVFPYMCPWQASEQYLLACACYKHMSLHSLRMCALMEIETKWRVYTTCMLEAAPRQSMPAFMAQATAGEEVAQASGDAPAAKVADLVAEFESAVANEDPFSGEIVVRTIERPFIAASEAAEVASWQL